MRSRRPLASLAPVAVLNTGVNQVDSVGSVEVVVFHSLADVIATFKPLTLTGEKKYMAPLGNCQRDNT